MTDGHLGPLVDIAQGDGPDRIREARAAAGRAIRNAGHALAGQHAPIELLDEFATTLNLLTSRLDAGAPRSREPVPRRSRSSGPPPDGSLMSNHDERPVSGRASPWGLDIEVHRDGDEAVATLTLRSAHEGAPGRSHGGIIAALFDEVFGFILVIAEAEPALTGELAVRYEGSVPIGEPLECRVRLDRREGRKLYMTGELMNVSSGQTLARSTATFVAIDLYRFVR